MTLLDLILAIAILVGILVVERLIRGEKVFPARTA